MSWRDSNLIRRSGTLLCALVKQPAVRPENLIREIRWRQRRQSARPGARYSRCRAANGAAKSGFQWSPMVQILSLHTDARVDGARLGILVARERLLRYNLLTQRAPPQKAWQGRVFCRAFAILGEIQVTATIWAVVGSGRLEA